MTGFLAYLRTKYGPRHMRTRAQEAARVAETLEYHARRWERACRYMAGQVPKALQEDAMARAKWYCEEGGYSLARAVRLTLLDYREGRLPGTPGVLLGRGFD